MNKKLIALAVAAAFAAPAAMADVTVYGKVHLDITSVDSPTADNIQVTNNSSRLGFKGSEDLGNGLKAIFKYEMTYDGVDSGTAIGGARNSYLGLAGDFGTFIVGRHDTPAKSAFYASGNDHLDSTTADLNSLGGYTERRTNNAIAYISPNMSGFKAAVAVVPGEESGMADTTSNPTAENDENGLMDSFSLGLMYKGNGVKAGLGYEKIADTSNIANADNNDATTMHVGASYSFDSFTVGAQYGVNDNVGNVQDDKETAWAISGKYAFGNNAIAANFGNMEAETAATNTTAETDFMGIGFTHKMSKRTSVWVAYGSTDPEGTDSTDSFGVGMVHNF